MKTIANLLWPPRHPAGDPVDPHHAVFRALVRLVRVDYTAMLGEYHFTAVAPGFGERDYKILVTPGMWAWLCAIHVAQAFKPDAVKLPWQEES